MLTFLLLLVVLSAASGTPNNVCSETKGYAVTASGECICDGANHYIGKAVVNKAYGTVSGCFIVDQTGYTYDPPPAGSQPDVSGTAICDAAAKYVGTATMDFTYGTLSGCFPCTRIGYAYNLPTGDDTSGTCTCDGTAKYIGTAVMDPSYGTLSGCFIVHQTGYTYDPPPAGSQPGESGTDICDAAAKYVGTATMDFTYGTLSGCFSCTATGYMFISPPLPSADPYVNAACVCDVSQNYIGVATMSHVYGTLSGCFTCDSVAGYKFVPPTSKSASYKQGTCTCDASQEFIGAAVINFKSQSPLSGCYTCKKIGYSFDDKSATCSCSNGFSGAVSLTAECGVAGCFPAGVKPFPDGDHCHPEICYCKGCVGAATCEPELIGYVVVDNIYNCTTGFCTSSFPSNYGNISRKSYLVEAAINVVSGVLVASEWYTVPSSDGNNPDSTNGNAGLSAGIIALIVIICVVAAAVLMFAGYRYRNEIGAIVRSSSGQQQASYTSLTV